MAPIFLVVYDGSDALPYATAFSTYRLARALASEIDGEVISTQIDVHACLIERPDSAVIGDAMGAFWNRVPQPEKESRGPTSICVACGVRNVKESDDD